MAGDVSPVAMFVVVVVVVEVVVVVVVVVGKHSGGIGSPSSLKFHNIRRSHELEISALLPAYVLVKKKLKECIILFGSW